MGFVKLEEQPPIVEIKMADGIFIKQIFLKKKNTYVPQHSHKYDHTSMLAVGSIAVWEGEIFSGEYSAPTGILIKAGIKHTFKTLEDNTLIYCIHNISRGEVEILEENHLVGED
jgi:quercetin dioxygenase-like cupin family protein